MNGEKKGIDYGGSGIVIVSRGVVFCVVQCRNAMR